MKKNKRKKLNIKKVFFILFFLVCISYSIYLLINIPVRTIYVTGNKFYSDEEILKLINIDKKTPLLLINNKKISKKIKNDKVIKNVKIKKNIFLEVEVKVDEKRLIYFDQNTKKTVLEDGTSIAYIDNDLPILLNNIDDKKIYNNFLTKMKKVTDNSLNIISEIKYNPNEIDKERFLVSMTDGNYVYLTLSKISKINEYSKISRTLSNKKGILYLDYGNYFLEK